MASRSAPSTTNFINAFEEPYLIVDIHDFSITNWNRAAEQIHESLKSTVPRCYGLLYGRDKPCGDSGHPCPIEQVRGTGHPEALEYLFSGSGEGRLYFQAQALPLADDQDEARWVALAYREVPQDRFRERSPQRDRAVFLEALDGVLLVDRNGLFDCNPSALALFQAPDASSLLGRHLAELAPDFQADGRSSREAAETCIRSAFREGRAACEWTHRTLKGAEFPAEVRLSRIDEESGSILAVIVREITDRGGALEPHREAQGRALQYLDAAPGLHLVLDGEGRIEAVNDRARRFLGLGQGEGPGRSWLRDFLVPEQRRQGQEDLEALMSGDGGSGEFRAYSVVTAGGEPQTLEFRATPLRDRRGETTGIMLSGAEPATGVREGPPRAERPRPEGEGLPNGLRAGVLRVDRAGRLAFLNRAALDLLGYDSDQGLLGQTAARALFGVEAEGERLSLTAEGREQGARLELKSDRFRRADGTSIPVRILVIPVEDETGLLGTWVAFDPAVGSGQPAGEGGTDELREAWEAGGMGYWVWDYRSNQLSWSETTYRIFGLAPNSYLALFEGLIGFVHPQDRQAFRESLDRALAAETPFDLDFRIVRPGGEERLLHSRARVTRDRAGDAIRMVGVVQDITGREKPEPVRERETPAINLDSLTPREREVLRHLAQGLTAKEVALELNLSHRTVEQYRARIMEKLGVRSFAEFIPLP